MAITWQDVVDVAAGVADAPSSEQATILAIVGRQINLEVWGLFADDGSKYLAAHLATLAKLRGSGHVTSEAVGALSRAYATPQGLMGSLGLTSYGAEYARLLGLLVGVHGLVP